MWFVILFIGGLLVYALVFIINVIRRNSVLQAQPESKKAALKFEENECRKPINKLNNF